MLVEKERAMALEKYPNWPPDVAFLKYIIEYKETPNALHALWNSLESILRLSDTQDQSTKALNQKLSLSFKKNENVNPQALDAALYYISTQYVMQGSVVMGPSLFYDLHEMICLQSEDIKPWFKYAARAAIGLSAQGLHTTIADDETTVMSWALQLRKFTFAVQVAEYNEKSGCSLKESESNTDHFSTISVNLVETCEGYLLGTVKVYDSLKLAEHITLRMANQQICTAKKLIEAVVGVVDWQESEAPTTTFKQPAASKACSSFTTHYVLRAHLGIPVYDDHPSEYELNQQAFEMASMSLRLSTKPSVVISKWQNVYLSIIGNQEYHLSPKLSLQNVLDRQVTMAARHSDDDTSHVSDQESTIPIPHGITKHPY